MASRVVLMCGLAGAGKTTHANRLVAEGLVRLSIDEYIFERYGVFGTDFNEAQWIAHQEEADRHVRQRLVELIRKDIDVVVDQSFWNRARRDDYKQLIELNGGQWELIFIKVDPAILSRRLLLRSQRSDANAFAVDAEMLARFIDGFEVPEGEGETIVESFDFTDE